MDTTALRAQIEGLDQGIETKPVLLSLFQSLESLGSDLAQARQTESDLNQDAPQHGTLHDPGCPYCDDLSRYIMAHGQMAGMAQGRDAILTEFDNAFAWAGRPDLAESVSTIYEEWERQGKPAAAQEAEATA